MSVKLPVKPSLTPMGSGSIVSWSVPQEKVPFDHNSLPVQLVRFDPYNWEDDAVPCTSRFWDIEA